MRALLVIGAGMALVAAAPVKLAPADDKPALVGAAARHKQGPDPSTRPPADVGSAEDPAPIATPPVTSPATPVTTTPKR